MVKYLINHLTHFLSILCSVPGRDLPLTDFREIFSEFVAESYNSQSVPFRAQSERSIKRFLINFADAKRHLQLQPCYRNMPSLFFTILCLFGGFATMGAIVLLVSLGSLLSSLKLLVTAPLPQTKDMASVCSSQVDFYTDISFLQCLRDFSVRLKSGVIRLFCATQADN